MRKYNVKWIREWIVIIWYRRIVLKRTSQIKSLLKNDENLITTGLSNQKDGPAQAQWRTATVNLEYYSVTNWWEVALLLNSVSNSAVFPLFSFVSTSFGLSDTFEKIWIVPTDHFKEQIDKVKHYSSLDVFFLSPFMA